MRKNNSQQDDDIKMRDSSNINAYLQESEGLLQSVFDTSLIGMSVLQAKRDEQGQIEDFVIRIVNKELERETGRTDLVGKLYAQEYPGIREAGIFTLMLKVMETGVPEQMEYFYPHEGFNKWFSCMFVKLNDGLVATNLDISSRKKAEEERVQMVISQNQKIYWATLNIQEIERKRIAESLHNGVGQLLYGVKMSLLQDYNKENLNIEQLLAQIEYITDHTDKLLDAAIKETRRISHELTPAILEEYGLTEAIEDLCRQFSHSLVIHCNFTGLINGIDQQMELAIYRITQELVMNIIKHARASKAAVNIHVNKKNVSIIVSDNGIGFNKKSKNDGIGLKTIQNKINLLNGTFKLESNSGQDSEVSILIPYIHI
ncbi:sensor histidine kinase [Mucilaginibacter sp. L3T2-6]|uniref:PAS domain-containing sensor histidine kinase n=1 Tax=Mucilaginibacter sp. L3T2-6 TaxID=3062491 RepID=UPI002676A96E|nr:sensor histidine kinase [Mucilaginibacter sp. L3T2-6]MDO3645263.1 sensor histidine kinase [Mucilaginibacter sp. L3T2-6]MDV6217715.1 sensor histidine kinase [Mucilaginibacter sp. L3T2-6]